MAGPKHGNLYGLLIALVAVAAIHLILLTWLSFRTEKDYFIGERTATVDWRGMVTHLNRLTAMLQAGVFRVWPMLCAVTEVAQFILLALILKELARLSKDRDSANNAGGLIVIFPGAIGVMLVISFITRLIFENAKIDLETAAYILGFLAIIILGGLCGVFAWAGLVCMSVRDGISYRSR